MSVELALFDDSSLDTDTRAFLKEKVQAIHTRLKRTAEDVIAIGEDLIAVQERLERENDGKQGLFLKWLNANFDLSKSTAYNFMAWAERFRETKIPEIGGTSTVLSELYNSDESIIEMVEKGQIEPTVPAIRQAQQEMQTRTYPHLTEHEAEISGYRGQEKWEEAWKREQKDRNEPQEGTEDIRFREHIIFSTPEETEEDRYTRAVDTGTVDYYHDDLRREAIARDEETRKEQRDTHVMRVMGSSDSPEWYTPTWIVEKVLELMGTIDLDPCSNSHEEPNVPASALYTKEDDGLKRAWHGKVYLNPPYGTVIGDWTNRLISTYKAGDVEEAIALLPGRIDTNWFSPLYEYLICIIKGRVQFENSPYSAPFPCVLVYLGDREDEFTKIFSSVGPIVKRIG